VIDLRPRDLNVWDRDQYYMRPTPRPRQVTVYETETETETDKVVSRDHGGLDTLTSLLYTRESCTKDCSIYFYQICTWKIGIIVCLNIVSRASPIQMLTVFLLVVRKSRIQFKLARLSMKLTLKLLFFCSTSRWERIQAERSLGQRR